MTSLPPRDQFGASTADILWKIKAVNFKPENPFTLTSGRLSPVYVDCRRIISFVEARRQIIDMAVNLLDAEIGREKLDAIAGGETAGIPFAAWIAEKMDKPMLYVRKKPKGFGRNAQIEGDFADGAKTLLVEDLTTDSGSKIGFVKALRDAGAVVTDAFVVFHYGIFPQSVENLRQIGVRLHALATWRDVLASARRNKYFPEDSLTEVQSFLDDPDGWQAKRAKA